jgi:hypothetical protein
MLWRIEVRDENEGLVRILLTPGGDRETALENVWPQIAALREERGEPNLMPGRIYSVGL